MPTTYKTPGVYVEEISVMPPSVAEVSTAIPAFIGYTEKNPSGANQPVKIATFLEYKDLFGGPAETTYTVNITGETVDSIEKTASKYQMYYGLDLYFKNGGGPCYIVSTGDYKEDGSVLKDDLESGLQALEKKDEPTIILFTEAVSLDPDNYYDLCNQVLTQCNKLGDRFGIFDVLDIETGVADFRQSIRNEPEYLKYGAAYTPYLLTSITHAYSDSGVTVKNGQIAGYQTNVNGINVVYMGDEAITFTVTIATNVDSPPFAVQDKELTINLSTDSAFPADIKTAWDKWKKGQDTLGYEISVAGNGSVAVNTAGTNNLDADSVTLQGLETANTTMYNNIITALSAQKVTLPPAAAIAGVYAATDRNRGVWKAPANVSLVSVTEPTKKITAEAQENLNVDTTAGKSVNAIRLFTGQGILVWGARTLAGNDNNWRYISVRRLFNTVEESCQQSTQFAVFEPNNANTWLKVKSMIDSYLYGLWQQGALFGSTPEEAYFTNVGLGKTMTSQDVLEGRMIVEIGLAAVRPAEFVILRFSHKLQES